MAIRITCTENLAKFERMVPEMCVRTDRTDGRTDGLRDLHSRHAYHITPLGWLGSRVVSVLDSGAEGPSSNVSRDAVG